MRPCPNTGRATCPAPDGAVCAAVATRHARFCQLADPEHPDHDPAYVAHLAGAEYRPAPGPGLLAKAANLAGAVVAHVAAGLPTATAEEAGRRLDLCRSCPEHFDPGGQSCSLCGCNMPVKVTWAEQRCPAGKW